MIWEVQHLESARPKMAFFITGLMTSSSPPGVIAHDPEKWEPVFGKGHTQTKSQHYRDSIYPITGLGTCAEDL